METIWLGYDGLDLPFREIAAVLFYHPALDARIAQTYGRVPRGVAARSPAELLRRRWADWRGGA